MKCMGRMARGAHAQQGHSMAAAFACAVVACESTREQTARMLAEGRTPGWAGVLSHGIAASLPHKERPAVYKRG